MSHRSLSASYNDLAMVAESFALRLKEADGLIAKKRNREASKIIASAKSDLLTFLGCNSYADLDEHGEIDGVSEDLEEGTLDYDLNGIREEFIQIHTRLNNIHKNIERSQMAKVREGINETIAMILSFIGEREIAIQSGSLADRWEPVDKEGLVDDRMPSGDDITRGKHLVCDGNTCRLVDDAIPDEQSEEEEAEVDFYELKEILLNFVNKDDIYSALEKNGKLCKGRKVELVNRLIQECSLSTEEVLSSLSMDSLRNILDMNDLPGGRSKVDNVDRVMSWILRHEPVIKIEELTSKKFTAMKFSEKPVLIDFYATWCEPCRYMENVINWINGERSCDQLIARINGERSESITSNHDVDSFPTMIIFRDGREIARMEGLLSRQQLLDWMSRYTS